jgi:hypothetical protein
MDKVSVSESLLIFIHYLTAFRKKSYYFTIYDKNRVIPFEKRKITIIHFLDSFNNLS